MSKQNFAVTYPDWLKNSGEDEDVCSAVFAVLIDAAVFGPDDSDNLLESIKETFDDLSEKQTKRVAELLIQHGYAKPKGK